MSFALFSGGIFHIKCQIYCRQVATQCCCSGFVAFTGFPEVFKNPISNPELRLQNVCNHFKNKYFKLILNSIILKTREKLK